MATIFEKSHEESTSDRSHKEFDLKQIAAVDTLVKKRRVMVTGKPLEEDEDVDKNPNLKPGCKGWLIANIVSLVDIAKTIVTMNFF